MRLSNCSKEQFTPSDRTQKDIQKGWGAQNNRIA
jgi:hypothetical protein